MADLTNETLKITNITLVEKESKTGNKWKEYSVEVVDQEKGTYYTLPIKKAPKTLEDGTIEDGGFTKAYLFYKERFNDWNQMFAEGTIKTIKVALSTKVSDWVFEEKTGTSTYKTIRFMEELSEVDQAMAAKQVEGQPTPDTTLTNAESEATEQPVAPVDEEVNVEEIPFN